MFISHSKIIRILAYASEPSKIPVYLCILRVQKYKYCEEKLKDNLYMLDLQNTSLIKLKR